ncbi:MAG: sigma-54 dependent transcriptional regulator [Pseudomonadota bacterium]
MSTPDILLIEDTPSLQLLYASVLRHAGYDVHCASTAEEGYRAFQAAPPPVVILDLMLPDRDGLSLLQELIALSPDTSVVVVTANGSISRAVEAMRAGAHEFLVKPFEEGRMLNAVRNAIQTSQRRMRDTPSGSAAMDLPLQEFMGFVGSSSSMQKVYARVRSVARSMATIFVTGESGTGKEVCAQAVHAASGRARGPFVPLNCGAIPSELLESEVFGHLKGSFTGAISDKVGAAAAADGGTLFLDEICEMPLALQTKLLRFLQTSSIQPVGAARPTKINVRIICATNRDPLEEVRLGRFREDLFYRLHVIPIHLPPLRDRDADVLEIAQALLARQGKEEGKNFSGLSAEVEDLFRALRWPGNVRQLQNAIRHVVVLHDGPRVTLDMLPDALVSTAMAAAPAQAAGRADATGWAHLHAMEGAGHGVLHEYGHRHPASGGAEAARRLDPELARDLVNAGLPAVNGEHVDLRGKTLAEIERLAIEFAISRNGGSIPKAARELGVSPSTIYRKREAWAEASRVS